MKAFQVLYLLCFTRPRYQVSVYRTTGPLVHEWDMSGKNEEGVTNSVDPDQTAPLKEQSD